MKNFWIPRISSRSPHCSNKPFFSSNHNPPPTPPLLPFFPTVPFSVRDLSPPLFVSPPHGSPLSFISPPSTHSLPLSVFPPCKPSFSSRPAPCPPKPCLFLPDLIFEEVFPSAFSQPPRLSFFPCPPEPQPALLKLRDFLPLPLILLHIRTSHSKIPCEFFSPPVSPVEAPSVPLLLPSR